MYIYKSVLLIIIMSIYSFSAENDSTRYKLSGWGYFTMGKVMSSPFEDKYAATIIDYDFDKKWLVDFDAGLKCMALFGTNGKARFHVGLTTAYLLQLQISQSAENFRRKFVFYLIDAAIENAFTRGNNTFFGEFGFFPVKYNPQSMNLGEYLFRSGTYPQYINSGFELADKEKLCGLHGSVKHVINDRFNLKADLYFTSGVRDFPVHDLSLAYILSANSKLIQFAAGIDHAHLITLDEHLTTPATDPYFSPESIFGDNVRIFDTVSLTETDTIIDTINPTFRGTKGMARVTFDPKALFNASVFGDEDLKLYCEAAFLGFKNYPVWWEKPLERMPVMFGLNLPAFKLLDVLAVEVEYYKSPYINTAENAWRYRSPLPFTGLAGHSKIEDVVPKHDDDWKWSVYASKKFGRMRISAQVASDHILKTPYVPGPPTSAKYTEICPGTKDWYWMLRAMFYL
jgi:hypothetical protein